MWKQSTYSELCGSMMMMTMMPFFFLRNALFFLYARIYARKRGQPPKSKTMKHE
jgi:hypothetical protein